MLYTHKHQRRIICHGIGNGNIRYWIAHALPNPIWKFLQKLTLTNGLYCKNSTEQRLKQDRSASVLPFILHSFSFRCHTSQPTVHWHSLTEMLDHDFTMPILFIRVTIASALDQANDRTSCKILNGNNERQVLFPFTYKINDMCILIIKKKNKSNRNLVIYIFFKRFIYHSWLHVSVHSNEFGFRMWNSKRFVGSLRWLNREFHAQTTTKNHSRSFDTQLIGGLNVRSVINRKYFSRNLFGSIHRFTWVRTQLFIAKPKSVAFVQLGLAKCRRIQIIDERQTNITINKYVYSNFTGWTYTNTTNTRWNNAFYSSTHRLHSPCDSNYRLTAAAHTLHANRK